MKGIRRERRDHLSLASPKDRAGHDITHRCYRHDALVGEALAKMVMLRADRVRYSVA